jgi:uncharacterized DUF497 family protein
MRYGFFSIRGGSPAKTPVATTVRSGLALGKIDGRLFAVAYTPRGTVIRLISARKANEREQRKYDETLST